MDGTVYKINVYILTRQRPLINELCAIYVKQDWFEINDCEKPMSVASKMEWTLVKIWK